MNSLARIHMKMYFKQLLDEALGPPEPGKPLAGSDRWPMEGSPDVVQLRTYEAAGRVPVIDTSALVHETAVLIGDVRIGPDCYIGPHSVCRGDQGSIVIGRGTSLQDCCVVHTRPGGRVAVGELGQIGHGAMLHGCTIGRNVLIGMGAIILDDAVIEDDAMVGAATLVTAGQRVPARMLVRGNPGKIAREVTGAELASKEEITMRYVSIARSREGARRAPAHIQGMAGRWGGEHPWRREGA